MTTRPVDPTDDDPIGYNCPRCGAPALTFPRVLTLICAIDDCTVLFWDPSQSRREFEATAQTIDLSRIFRTPGGMQPAGEE